MSSHSAIKHHYKKYVDNPWSELSVTVKVNDKNFLEEAVKELLTVIESGPKVDCPTMDVSWLDPGDSKGYLHGYAPPPFSPVAAQKILQEAHGEFLTAFEQVKWLGLDEVNWFSNSAEPNTKPFLPPSNAVELVEEAASAYVKFRQHYEFFKEIIDDSRSRMEHVYLKAGPETESRELLRKELEEEWLKIYYKAFPECIFGTPKDEAAALELGRLAVGYDVYFSWSNGFFGRAWAPEHSHFYETALELCVRAYGDPFSVKFSEAICEDRFPTSEEARARGRREMFKFRTLFREHLTLNFR